jgi:hypothetical protein
MCELLIEHLKLFFKILCCDYFVVFPRCGAGVYFFGVLDYLFEGGGYCV